MTVLKAKPHLIDDVSEFYGRTIAPMEFKYKISGRANPFRYYKTWRGVASKDKAEFSLNGIQISATGKVTIIAGKAAIAAQRAKPRKRPVKIVRPSSSNELLDRLVCGLVTPQERREFIFKLEEVGIPSEGHSVWSHWVRNYILEQRDTLDDLERLAVLSAIRSYVSDLPVSDLADLVPLLDHEDKSPHISVELELAKMILRKLAANPILRIGTHEPICEMFMDVVRGALPSRQLRRKWYAAACVFSAAAIIALQSARIEEVVSLISDADTWIRQSLQDTLRSHMSQIHPGLQVSELLAAIQSIVDRLAT